jgi:hypothetical protein
VFHERLSRETLAHESNDREDFGTEQPFVRRNRVFEDDGSVRMAVVANPIVSESDVPERHAFAFGRVGATWAHVLSALDGSVGPSNTPTS